MIRNIWTEERMQLWNFKRTTYFEMVCITISTAASILHWQHWIFHCEWIYWEPQWTLCSRVRLYKCTVRSTRKTQFERKLFRLKSFGRVLPVSLHRVCTTLKGFETWHIWKKKVSLFFKELCLKVRQCNNVQKIFQIFQIFTKFHLNPLPQRSFRPFSWFCL